VLNYNRQERLARSKHPSALDPFIRYEENEVLSMQTLTLSRLNSKVRFLSLSLNIRLGWRWQKVVNTLAYYGKYFDQGWKVLSCKIFTHLATLLHLTMLQWLRAQAIAPPTPFLLWPLGQKKSRSLSGLPPLLIYQDIHWCLHKRTVYILYVLQISRV